MRYNIYRIKYGGYRTMNDEKRAAKLLAKVTKGKGTLHSTEVPLYSDTWHREATAGYGKYKGYEFVITTLGTNPCAYVKLFKRFRVNLLNNFDAFDWINVHKAGIDWADERKDAKFWIGWCYGQQGDYDGTKPDPSHTQYTLADIREDVKSVINQILMCKYSPLWYKMKRAK